MDVLAAILEKYAILKNYGDDLKLLTVHDSLEFLNQKVLVTQEKLTASDLPKKSRKLLKKESADVEAAIAEIRRKLSEVSWTQLSGGSNVDDKADEAAADPPPALTLRRP